MSREHGRRPAGDNPVRRPARALRWSVAGLTAGGAVPRLVRGRHLPARTAFRGCRVGQRRPRWPPRHPWRGWAELSRSAERRSPRRWRGLSRWRAREDSNL